MVALVPHTCVKGRGPGVLRHWHRLRFGSRLPPTSSFHVMALEHIATFALKVASTRFFGLKTVGSHKLWFFSTEISVPRRCAPCLRSSKRFRTGRMVFCSSPAPRQVPIPPPRTTRFCKHPLLRLNQGKVTFMHTF